MPSRDQTIADLERDNHRLRVELQREQARHRRTTEELLDALERCRVLRRVIERLAEE